MKEIVVVNVCLKEEYRILAPDRISNEEEGAPFFIEQIGAGSIERFSLLCCNYDYRPISYSVIGVGTDSKILIDPGEIFRVALLSDAKHIMIAHNHLGSSLEPTESDIFTTKEIGYVGNILHIPLIDSLVVNADKHYLSIRKYVMKKAKESGVDQDI